MAFTFMRNIFNRKQADDLDKEFLDSYRRLLFSQYVSLSNTMPDDKAKAEADRIASKTPDQITWEDLYQLEAQIIKLEPVESLKRRLWILRNEYKEVASADEVKDYLLSIPPDPKTASDVELRADASLLQQELNWRYVIIWVFESFRGELIKTLTTVLVILLSLLLLLVIFWGKLTNFAADTLNWPIVAVIVIPGILGGLISTLRRIQKAKWTSNADLDLTELQQGKMGIYLSPLLGGVFAIILFALFAGGFMTGGLFPSLSFDFILPGEHAEIDMVQIAKILIWSFIAGFAEQFVPDRLERFAKQDGQDKKS